MSYYHSSLVELLLRSALCRWWCARNPPELLDGKAANTIPFRCSLPLASRENRFGSANVLFMASTVMVPMGNLVFSLPFMPGSTPLKDSDIAGLGVILLGLVTYRLGDKCDVVARWRRGGTVIPRMPWRRGTKKTNRGISMTEDQFEWDTPVFHDGNEHQFASSSLGEPLLLTPIR